MVQQYVASFPRVEQVCKRVMAQTYKNRMSGTSQGCRAYKNIYLNAQECDILALYLNQVLSYGHWHRAGLPIPTSQAVREVLIELELM